MSRESVTVLEVSLLVKHYVFGFVLVLFNTKSNTLLPTVLSFLSHIINNMLHVIIKYLQYLMAATFCMESIYVCIMYGHHI